MRIRRAARGGVAASARRRARRARAAADGSPTKAAALADEGAGEGARAEDDAERARAWRKHLRYWREVYAPGSFEHAYLLFSSGLPWARWRRAARELDGALAERCGDGAVDGAREGAGAQAAATEPVTEEGLA